MSMSNRTDKPRYPNSPKPVTGWTTDKPSRTKQAHKDECDINRIMAKYQKTGAIAHVTKYKPAYTFLTGDGFTECMQKVQLAEEMFADLPSKLRRKFEGNPALFLKYVQDPANLPEMVELGLANKTDIPVKETSNVPDIQNP